mmetsp:Transcript_63216/g.93810  ORF Transcript_63216/g.93810 Transcript_63216/m.93810 type:complete len:89 (-) Transcript_63216:836-1102(-)
MLGTPRPWWRSAVFSVTGTSTNETLGYLFARWKKAGVIALHACAKFKGKESTKKMLDEILCWRVTSSKRRKQTHMCLSKSLRASENST